MHAKQDQDFMKIKDLLESRVAENGDEDKQSGESEPVTKVVVTKDARWRDVN